MKKYKVIVNPISGRGAGEREYPVIKQLLQTYDLDFDMVRTEYPWHAAELTQKAVSQGYNVIVAVGGDGTSNEVLNGLMLAQADGGHHDAIMGVLRVGRGNDFGFSVGIPENLADGCRMLAEGRPRTIDVGHVVGGLYPQGRYFGNGVGIGFDAVTGFEAAKMKRLHGFASYVVAALKTIFLYYQAPLLRMEYNDQTLIQPSLLVSIMNGRRMGGDFMMTPHAKTNDGLLDLCIARSISRLQIFLLILRFIKGTQATHAAIQTGQTKRIVVTALEGSIPAHADGETLCTEGEQLAIEILPQQVQILSYPEKE